MWSRWENIPSTLLTTCLSHRETPIEKEYLFHVIVGCSFVCHHGVQVENIFFLFCHCKNGKKNASLNEHLYFKKYICNKCL